MTAAETIAAAIEKLTELRAAGAAGEDEWKVWRASSGIRSSADYEWVVFDDGDATSRYRIAEKQNWGTSADMQMIVSLHRAIDPMLAILRHARWYAGAHLPDEFANDIVANGLALARAILGAVA